VSSERELEHEPVEKEVLSSQVKDRILTWILQGDLPPGSRLVETRLARQLGTSQAPIREALRDLATLGFIETQAYKGSWVRKPSKRELVDAVQVRAELEGLAARLAAEKRSEQCIKDLEDLFEAMAAAAERGDPHDHALLNTRFHARIVESSGNETLQRHWSMLEPFGRTYITASAEGIDLHWLGDRHRGILDAIRDQDADLAAEKARSHAEEVKELLENFAHPELQEEKPEA
jgi:DNA-binding GntR family transcriptional regulator